MKKIFIMLLVSALCGAMYAATPIAPESNNVASITGYITDEDGSALVGATVYVPELQRGTISDMDGKYRLNKLPMGKKLHIRIAYVGFETMIKEVILSQSVVTMNIKLDHSVIQTEDVVITGGYVTSQHENAVKIDIVRPDDLLTTPNLTQALAQVPGVDVISKGNGPTKPVIHGLWGNNIMVLQDGIKVENYQYSENHPMSVDNTNLGHVEVIKGPASLLYGSDAIGGVVNFVAAPLAPEGKTQGRVTSQVFSATEGWNTLAEINTTQGAISGGLSIKRNQHADYRQGNGDDAENSRFNQTNLKGYLAYSLPNGVFKLSAEQFDQKLGMTVGGALPLVTYNSHHNSLWYQDLRRRIIRSDNTVFLGKVKWDIKGSWQETLRKLQVTSPDPNLEMALTTYTIDSKWSIPTSEVSNLIVGLQGKVQDNENKNDRVEKLLPDTDINSWAVVGLYQTAIGDKWNVQGGLRYDWSTIKTKDHEEEEEHGHDEHEHEEISVDKHFNNISGDISANYRPNDNWTIRLNVAHAFRVPTLSEFTSDGHHGARMEFGNPDLDTQEATNIDLSAHYHSRLVTFDVAGFYNKINNYIYAQLTGETDADSGSPMYQYRQDDAKLYGGEAGIHVHPEMIPWLHVQSTYSYVVGKRDDDVRLPFIPAQKFRTELRAELPSSRYFKRNRISLNNLSTLRQDEPGEFETETAGYSIWGMKASTEIQVEKQPIQVSLTADNLLDKTYIDHLSTLKPMGIYNQGRSFILSVTVPFGW